MSANKKYRWVTSGAVQCMIDRNRFTRAIIYEDGGAGMGTWHGVSGLGTVQGPVEDSMEIMKTVFRLKRWCERVIRERGY